MNHMRQRGGWLAGVLVLTAWLLGAGCATTTETASDPDAQIEQAVTDRLNQEMLAARGGLMASSRDGVVTLHGVVRNEAQRARAIAIVRSTSGVREVVDRLRSN